MKPNSSAIAAAMLARARNDVRRQVELREYFKGVDEEPRLVPMRHVEHERSDDLATRV